MVQEQGNEVRGMIRNFFRPICYKLDWVEFSAEGFSKPVAGIIHRVAHPAVCGMPLGGIDTGCIDLETNGTFGYCTIFNSQIPCRGPLNLPFLGFGLGR